MIEKKCVQYPKQRNILNIYPYPGVLPFSIRMCILTLLNLQLSYLLPNKHLLHLGQFQRILVLFGSNLKNCKYPGTFDVVKLT